MKEPDLLTPEGFSNIARELELELEPSKGFKPFEGWFWLGTPIKRMKKPDLLTPEGFSNIDRIANNE